MRSLEECKAEIFRRSEDRIKNHKKNIVGRVVISGISTAAAVLLIACAVRWMTTIGITDRVPSGNNKEENEDAMGLPNGNGSAGLEENIAGNLTMGSNSAIELEFKAQYIRMNGIDEDVIYPTALIIRSVEELKEYCKNISTEEFLKACDKYNENYFENQVLVLVAIQEGSGSISHNVKSLTTKGIVTGNEMTYKLTIEIEYIVPEAGTCDMAQWHFIIEPKAMVYVESNEDIEFVLIQKECK